MSILDPEYLLEQAVRLIGAGPARDVDLRRAISSAYYALFHAVMAGVGDTLVGRTHQTTPRYALVYRGIDHRTLKNLCLDVQKSSPPAKYRPYILAERFGFELTAFSSAVVELQEARQEADHDPRRRFRTLNARSTIDLARTGLGHWKRIKAEEKALFLTMLAFPPR